MKDVLRNLPVPEEQLAAMAVGLVLRYRWRAPLPGGASVHRVAGWSLLAAGGVLNGWALSERRCHSAGAFDLERPDSLVTTGPYSLSRHPMYVGWWLIHLGAGALGGSRWVLATVPAAILMGHPGAKREEQELAGAFGEDFKRYAARTPRYLPHRFLPADGRA